MSRAIQIAFWIICFSYAMSFMHEVNGCYQFGNTLSHCPDEAGTNRPFIPFEFNPLFTYSIRDGNNNVINASDPDAVQAALQDAAQYKPGPESLIDSFGFFSWVVTGGRFLVNGFFMTLTGFPSLMQQFWIPYIAALPIGAILFIIQMIGLYEFFSGRELF